MLLLCWASQASSGVCVVSFVRATVAFVVSSNLPQRSGSSTGVLLVESWRNGTLPCAQRRATEAENALKHCLASADIDVDGVTGVPLFFPQAYNSSAVVIINHEPRYTAGRIRGTADKTRVGIEIFSLGCPHPLGPRVHLPNRTHKFVSSLIPLSDLGWTKGLILVLIRNI